MELSQYVPVGIVQTTLNFAAAWPRTGSIPKISPLEDSRAWNEIAKAMRSFVDGGRKPKIILLPELSLPRTRLDAFDRLVAELNAIAIVGVDYDLDFRRKRARNLGMVFIPRGFWQERSRRGCARVVFGKSHPAPAEKSGLERLSPSWTFVGDDKVYLFDAEHYGQIGVSICYDFMDLERALMYRAKVHHLFVIAYNRDLGMFQSLADSLARTVFCNVVIANTGFYGGSLAVAPYFDAHRRKLYGHDGHSLFTTQVVNLPVRDLELAMRGSGPTHKVDEKVVADFKHPPPGADASAMRALTLQSLRPSEKSR